jgi:hypothetical protein
MFIASNTADFELREFSGTGLAATKFSIFLMSATHYGREDRLTWAGAASAEAH